MVWAALYKVPELMGYGAWWALQDDEAKNLSDATQGLMKSIPAAQRKKVMEAMDKYLPITTFIGTVGIITYPRVLHTKMALAMKGTVTPNETVNARTVRQNQTTSNDTTIRHENPDDVLRNYN